jgi:CheY-like chemotaxis protein
MINAKQAMPEGGTVTISGSQLRIGLDESFPLRPGDYVKLTIRDQGVGIAREHLPKIFDPYFTTKQNGNGLGLATAYSIIRKHDGYITVDSKTGRGATFTIYLPVSTKKLRKHAEVSQNTPLQKLKVLVMDDEEIIREVAREMLSGLGFEAGLAADGSEAIELYKKARDAGAPFDVVILDLTVPGGMGGKDVIRKLWEIDPGVRGIVSSGYSNDPVISEFRQYGFSGVVAKPYKIQDLSEALRLVMAQDTELVTKTNCSHLPTSSTLRSGSEACPRLDVD